MKKNAFPFLTDMIVCLAVLALLYLLNVNQKLFLLGNRLPDYTGSFLWANLTIFGDALLAAVLLFPFIRKKPKLIWTALLAAVVATLLVHTLKPLLNVPRPAAVLNNDVINIIGPAHHHRAFPSGHTASAFTVAGVVMIYSQRYWQRIAVYLLAWSAGISRMAVGVHWPADVLCGATIGLFGAACGFWLVNKLKREQNRTAQLIWGGVFIIAALVLLLFHDSRYPQAIWMQRIIAVTVLVAGGIEYLKLIRKK